MVQILYTPSFLRQFHKLESDLQDEVERAIEIFRQNPKHPSLKAHKLKGSLQGYWSFSVNYKYRIVFEYDDKNTVAFLKVGDHDVYR